jgi:sporulation protein YlmC with PRC-barrel domain
MKRFAAISLLALLVAAPATAQQAANSKILTNVPDQSVTVTDWYKQNVYDGSNSKIGEVMDVLLAPDGKVSALIVGVGGFLGMGEKDVAVPFGSIKHTARDGKIYLTMDTTKDELKAAPGVKYDRTSTTWVPDTGSTKTPASNSK